MDNTLVDSLMIDKQLEEEPDKRQLYISYANLFCGDLGANLYLTSLELDEKYSTGRPASWQKFLKHNTVKKFIDSFMLEKQDKIADKAIEKGVKARDALSLKKDVVERTKKETNERLIVMFLPQKDYEDI